MNKRRIITTNHLSIKNIINISSLYHFLAFSVFNIDCFLFKYFLYLKIIYLIFKVVKPYGCVMLGTYDICLSKPIEYITQRVKSNVSYRL